MATFTTKSGVAFCLLVLGFFLFFFNIRTMLLILRTQGIAPYRFSIHHSTEWIPLKETPRMI